MKNEKKYRNIEKVIAKKEKMWHNIVVSEWHLSRNHMIVTNNNKS